MNAAEGLISNLFRVSRCARRLANLADDNQLQATYRRSWTVYDQAGVTLLWWLDQNDQYRAIRLDTILTR